MIPVGRIVSESVSPHLECAHVESILHSADLAGLAAATRDPRLSAAGWEHCLRYELALLVNWLARRTLRHRESATGSGGAPETVLTLLPRYGFALHALRRSIPFAALGIHTTISVRDDLRSSAAEVITPLIRTLGIDDLVSLTEAPPPIAVRHAVSHHTSIFITGQLATWRHLSDQYPTARITGATGECAAIISRDPAAADQIARALANRALPISCTNHQLTLITDQPTEESPVTEATGPLGTARPGTVADELRRVHPSVVLIPDDDDLPDSGTLAGYRAVQCDTLGVADTTAGFGQDPVAGWPGDHYV